MTISRGDVRLRSRGRELTTAYKIGFVAAGYVIAFLVASAAVAVRVAGTTGPEAQASSGMYAFGDAYLFILVFGLVALIPTGAALYFLRPYRRFWIVLSALGVGVAFTGAAAAVLFTLGRSAFAPSTLAEWASYSVLRILLAPVFAPAFLVVAFITPHRSARLALFAAAVVELAVIAFAGFTWFLPLVFHERT
jgi:hypothetical protein